MRVIKKHPVTSGYKLAEKSKGEGKWNFEKGRVRIRYANGGFLVVGKGVDVLVSFDEEDMFGAIVAGRRGKGKVVLVSPHTESTPPRDESSSWLKWSQDPLKLFKNSVRYISSERNILPSGANTDTWRR